MRWRGHFAFGARTGGSVVIYGVIFLVMGLFFSQGFADVVQIFPLPVLGVLLRLEALSLAKLLRDTSGSRPDLIVALLVGLLCAGLPYGYLVGPVVGPAIYYAMQRGWGSCSCQLLSVRLSHL